MKNIKKTLIVTLALFVLLALLPAFASAKVIASGYDNEDQTGWTLTDSGVLTITGTYIHDYSDSDPAPWTAYRDSIHSVVINSGIYYIGSSAFLDCDAMTSVTIPDGVQYICYHAFQGCTSLTWVTIPDSVITISGYAFSGCTELTGVELPDGITAIAYNVFQGCTRLSSVAIPYGVTRIGSQAFDGCTALTSIDIPETVYHIDEYAFYGCSNLTSVILPNGVNTISQYAFSGCTSLASITVPPSVTTIQREAFYNCPKLHRINISDLAAWCNISFDDYLVFSNVSRRVYLNDEEIVDLVVPTDVTTIPGDAFSFCPGLKSVTISDGVTTIDDYAFAKCANLTRVVIPSSVNSIRTGAFWGCDALARVEITDLAAWCEMSYNSASFERAACLYLNGAKVTDLIIPESVTFIQKSAFRGFASIDSVTIPAGVSSIHADAFKGCGALDVYISDLAAWCEIYLGQTYESGEYYGPFDEIRHLYLNGKEITDLVVPNGVERVSKNVFENRSTIRSVTVPADVYSIQASAFAYCGGIRSVAIQNGVEVIDQRAFWNCAGMTSVIIPNSVTFIGDGAFSGCTGLTDVYYTGSYSQWRGIDIEDIDFGNAELTGATIHYNAPTITQQPTDVKVASGERAVFSLTAEGSGLAFQWQYSSDGGSTWKNSTAASAKTDTLDVAGSYANSRLLYRCVVTTGAGGEATTHAVCMVLSPRVAAHPHNLTVKTGDRIRLTAAGEGGRLEYQWQYLSGSVWKNCSSSSAVTPTLNIAGTAANAKYKYRCVISNTKGSVNSNAATVTLTDNQVFTVYYHSSDSAPAAPQDTLVVYNTSTNILTVAKLGFAKSGYTFGGWRVQRISDGKWRALNSEGKYVWAELTDGALPAGHTWCLYEDGKSIKNPISSGELHLFAQWIKQPTITTQPKNVTVTNNSRAKFTVIAAGGNLSYKWQYSSDRGSTWKNSTASSAQTATLDIAGVAANAKLLYRCVVSNTLGSVKTNSVRVIVSDIKPVILVQPKNVTVKSSEKAKFSVQASGVNLTYQWQYSSDGKTWKDSSATGAKTNQVSVGATAANAKLLYRCAVKNAKGTTYSGSARLTVSDIKPVILTQPVNTTVKANERAGFSVTASGVGLSYQWQYSSDRGATWKNSTADTAKQASLNIAGTTANAKLLYRCAVKNAKGTTYTDSVRVTISDAKPIILVQPKNATVKSGEKAKFTVVVSGVGLSYQWQYSSDGGGTWKDSGATGAKTNQVSVSGTASNAKLLYRCKVTNSYGTVYTNRVKLTLS